MLIIFQEGPKSLSRFSPIQLFTTPWTVAHEAPAPLSMGFSRQEHWDELPCPSPGELPDSGIKPMSPFSSCIAGKFFTAEPPRSRGGIKSLGREIEMGAVFFKLQTVSSQTQAGTEGKLSVKWHLLSIK